MLSMDTIYEGPRTHHALISKEGNTAHRSADLVQALDRCWDAIVAEACRKSLAYTRSSASQ